MLAPDEHERLGARHDATADASARARRRGVARSSSPCATAPSSATPGGRPPSTPPSTFRLSSLPADAIFHGFVHVERAERHRGISTALFSAGEMFLHERGTRELLVPHEDRECRGRARRARQMGRPLAAHCATLSYLKVGSRTRRTLSSESGVSIPIPLSDVPGQPIDSAQSPARTSHRAVRGHARHHRGNAQRPRTRARDRARTACFRHLDALSHLHALHAAVRAWCAARTRARDRAGTRARRPRGHCALRSLRAHHARLDHRNGGHDLARRAHGVIHGHGPDLAHRASRRCARRRARGAVGVCDHLPARAARAEPLRAARDRERVAASRRSRCDGLPIRPAGRDRGFRHRRSREPLDRAPLCTIPSGARAAAAATPAGHRRSARTLSALTIALGTADRLVVAAYGGAAMLGLYAFGVSIAGLAASFAWIIRTVIFPDVYGSARIAGAAPAMREHLDRTVLPFAYLFPPILGALALAMEPAIALALPRYLAAAAARVFIFAAAAGGVTTLGVIGVVATGRQRVLPVLSGFALAINLACSTLALHFGWGSQWSQEVRCSRRRRLRREYCDRRRPSDGAASAHDRREGDASARWCIAIVALMSRCTTRARSREAQHRSARICCCFSRSHR